MTIKTFSWDCQALDILTIPEPLLTAIYLVRAEQSSTAKGDFTDLLPYDYVEGVDPTWVEHSEIDQAIWLLYPDYDFRQIH